MFVFVIFHLFYVFVKMCVVFMVELDVNIIPVNYGWELILTRYMHSLQIYGHRQASMLLNTYKTNIYIYIYIYRERERATNIIVMLICCQKSIKIFLKCSMTFWAEKKSKTQRPKCLSTIFFILPMTFTLPTPYLKVSVKIINVHIFFLH